MAKTPQERIEAKRKVITAYQNLFKGKDGQIVLEDMKKRFYAEYPTYTVGMPERMEAENAGMRRAWLHINRMINANTNDIKLTTDELQGE